MSYVTNNSIETRAKNFSPNIIWQQNLYKEIAYEQREIDRKEYEELINELIDKLQTSRAYHLGITGLDSDAEIARKEREGNTALIRGIDGTIKYVKEKLNEI